MQHSEVEKFYQRACGVRRLTPQVEEGREWARILREFDHKDADAAINAWWTNTATDSNGDLKSKWLPTPAELRQAVWAAKRRREVSTSIRKDFVAWKCSSCPYTCSGFSNSAEAPAHCGRAMDEQYRESERSVAC
jgi:hypothetical protein